MYVIGKNIFIDELQELVTRYSKVYIVCDHKIDEGKVMNRTWPDVVVECCQIVATEENKTSKAKEQIENCLFENELDRDSCVVAIGGGITTDIVGFVASTFLRGIHLINIPTTLLAQADASIGSKNGINTKYGKNLIGSFKEPDAVIIDLSFLDTLPRIEIKNGLAEMVKYGAIIDEELFGHLEEEENLINEKNIKRCIDLKLDIVSKDLYDMKGIRSSLNFGHTIGHAIESASKFSVPHGKAVAIGMTIESSIAEKLIGFKDKERIVALLRKLEIINDDDYQISLDSLLPFMKRDKKNKEDKIAFALPNKIGSFQNVSITESELGEAYGR